jgi:hypothetical protein
MPRNGLIRGKVVKDAPSGPTFSASSLLRLPRRTLTNSNVVPMLEHHGPIMLLGRIVQPASDGRKTCLRSASGVAQRN